MIPPSNQAGVNSELQSLGGSNYDLFVVQDNVNLRNNATINILEIVWLMDHVYKFKIIITNQEWKQTDSENLKRVQL